jgi:hypothetical protein
MNSTEKMEAQLEVSDEQDGGAIVALPEGEENPQIDEIIEEAPQKEARSEEKVEINDEAVREERRKERKSRRVVHKEKEKEAYSLISSLRKQNEMLAERLSAVENRTSGAEFARIDKSIDDAATQVEYSKLKMREAVNSGNGDAVIEAQEMFYESKRKLESLQVMKNNAEKAIKQPKKNLSVPDPQVQRLAAEWIEENPWYDPSGGNEQSEIAQVIDKRLTAEGYNPGTQEYWDELSDRIEQYMPVDRSAKPASVPRRQTVMSSGRDSSPVTAQNQFRLSPDRVAAIKEAGFWDNPEKKMMMIKKYMEYDRVNKGRN